MLTYKWGTVRKYEADFLGITAKMLLTVSEQGIPWWKESSGKMNVPYHCARWTGCKDTRLGGCCYDPGMTP